MRTNMPRNIIINISWRNDKIVKLTVHRQKTTVQKFFVRNHKKCARISATKERRNTNTA